MFGQHVAATVTNKKNDKFLERWILFICGVRKMERGVIKIGRNGLLYTDAITGMERVEATDKTVAYLLVHLGKNSMRVIDETEQLKVKSCVPVKVPRLLGFLACFDGCCNTMMTDGRTRFICNDEPGFALYHAIHKNDMN